MAQASFTIVSALLVLVASTSSVLGGEITFGKLRFPAPEGWTVKDVQLPGANGTIKTLSPKDHANAAVVHVLTPVQMHGMSLDQRVKSALQKLDAGRTVIKPLPGGTTKTGRGFGCGVAGQITKGPKGDVRFRMVYGFCVGSEFQVMTVLAGNPPAFQATIKGLSPSIDVLRVVFPAAGVPPGLDPVSQSFLHATFDLHRGLAAQEASTANEACYSLQAPVGGGATFAVSLRIDLQATVPADARDSLAGWLRSADFGVKRGKGKLRINAHDFQADGRKITRVSVEERQQGGWKSRYVGALGYGPDWSLRVGAAVGDSKGFWKLSPAQRNALGAYAFKELEAIVLGIAGSVRWGDEPKEDKALVQRLIKKKTYRYNLAHRGGSGEFSFYSQKHSYWTFHADQSCEIDTDTFSAFSDVERDLAGNRTGAAMGTADGAGRKGRARFTVIKHGSQAYLVALYAFGDTTLHALAFDAKGSYGASENFVGLSVDGKIEGSYQSGKDYKYRE